LLEEQPGLKVKRYEKYKQRTPYFFYHKSLALYAYVSDLPIYQWTMSHIQHLSSHNQIVMFHMIFIIHGISTFIKLVSPQLETSKSSASASSSNMYFSLSPQSHKPIIIWRNIIPIILIFFHNMLLLDQFAIINTTSFFFCFKQFLFLVWHKIIINSIHTL
jgi:hypothetical protein